MFDLLSKEMIKIKIIYFLMSRHIIHSMKLNKHTITDIVRVIFVNNVPIYLVKA